MGQTESEISRCRLWLVISSGIKKSRPHLVQCARATTMLFLLEGGRGLKVLFIYFLKEGKGRRKRGRRTTRCGSFWHAPYWGPGQQARHVLWLGIEPGTLQFPGLCLIHPGTLARVRLLLLEEILQHFFHKKLGSGANELEGAVCPCSQRENALCWKHLILRIHFHLLIKYII